MCLPWGCSWPIVVLGQFSGKSIPFNPAKPHTPILGHCPRQTQQMIANFWYLEHLCKLPETGSPAGTVILAGPLSPDSSAQTDSPHQIGVGAYNCTRSVLPQ